MKSILGITTVLLFGAFCLLQSGTKVGDLITNTEAKNVWAGACYGGATVPRSVCSSTCGGTKKVTGITETQSGNSLEETGKCDTGGTCKYSEIDSSATGCGGG